MFAAVMIATALVVTGAAANYAGFVKIAGASLGSMCGAITADYMVSGKRWLGPRAGINPPGFAAWVLGFVVGMLPVVVPSAGYSFATAFLIYTILAKMGLKSAIVWPPSHHSAWQSS
jgi:cytosine permease